MINKNILTAGAFILSMLVLVAATNINSNEVILNPDRKALTGVVVDADSEEAIPNATVYLKKNNNDDGMKADRTQQQQQQQQQDRAVDQEQDVIDETTTNQNGEFEFDNIEQLRAQLGNRDRVHERQQEQQHEQQQQQQALEGEDETVILVVEAPGYETKEKEIKLSEYLGDRADEKGAMERDRDRDKDKDKDKIKIKLTRAN